MFNCSEFKQPHLVSAFDIEQRTSRRLWCIFANQIFKNQILSMWSDDWKITCIFPLWWSLFQKKDIQQCTSFQMIQQSRMSSSEYGSSSNEHHQLTEFLFLQATAGICVLTVTPQNSLVLCHSVQPNAFLVCCCRLTVCSQQVKLGLLVNEMLSLSSTIFPKHILCPKNL